MNLWQQIRVAYLGWLHILTVNKLYAGTAELVCCYRKLQLIWTSVVVQLFCLNMWVFFCLNTVGFASGGHCVVVCFSC